MADRLQTASAIDSKKYMMAVNSLANQHIVPYYKNNPLDITHKIWRIYIDLTTDSDSFVTGPLKSPDNHEQAGQLIPWPDSQPMADLDNTIVKMIDALNRSPIDAVMIIIMVKNSTGQRHIFNSGIKISR